MRYRHHVFICDNVRPADDLRGSCGAKCGQELKDAFKAERVANVQRQVVASVFD